MKKNSPFHLFSGWAEMLVWGIGIVLVLMLMSVLCPILGVHPLSFGG